LEDLATKYEDTYEDDDFELEIVDEDDAKPKKGRKGKKKEHDSTATVTGMSTMRKITEAEQFKGLKRDLTMSATLSSHEIHYKEQYWPVPTRVIDYLIEIVENPKVAKDISDMMNNKSEAERKKAEDGEVRYFKIINYDINIPYRARELGYIKVYKDNSDKLKTRIHLLDDMLKLNNIDYNKTLKLVEKKAAEIIE
jgi:hypothetical protein